MDEARRLEIPVFLNLEHGHQDPDILSRYVGRSTICQAVTDAAQCGECDPLTVAHKLLDAGAKTAIITLAGEGCLVVRGNKSWHVWPPEVQVVDGCGAGATFSTGFIYGVIRDWTMEHTVRFATAAASLKVARVGLKVEPVAEVKRLARQLQVEKGEVI
jgi:fructose-1-phosphate kinase PfkB-like protein